MKSNSLENFYVENINFIKFRKLVFMTCHFKSNTRKSYKLLPNFRDIKMQDYIHFSVNKVVNLVTTRTSEKDV